MRTLRKHLGFVAPLTALLLIVSPLAQARASDIQSYLNAVNRLYQNLENERALDTLVRARKFSRGPEDDALLAFYEGIILADLGRKEESLAAFKTGLFLRPDAGLPLKVSPKVEKEFEQLRAEVKKELAPLHARQEAERKERARQEAEEQQAARLRASEEAAARARAEGSTRGLPGGALSTDVQAPASMGAPMATWLLGGVAGASGVAGGVFGLLAQQNHGLAQTATVQNRRAELMNTRDGQALTANVLFGTAGAAAVGAVVTYLLNGAQASASP